MGRCDVNAALTLSEFDLSVWRDRATPPSPNVNASKAAGRIQSFMREKRDDGRMATTRRQRFVNGQIAWMLASILGLAVIGTLTFELFVLLSFIGFMLLTLLTAPVNLTPRWRARLKWPIIVGFVAFAYFVLRNALTVISTVF